MFEGLAMEKLEKDWIRYPVLHLDLNIEKYDTPESLDKILHDIIWMPNCMSLLKREECHTTSFVTI